MQNNLCKLERKTLGSIQQSVAIKFLIIALIFLRKFIKKGLVYDFFPLCLYDVIHVTINIE